MFKHHPHPHHGQRFARHDTASDLHSQGDEGRHREHRRHRHGGGHGTSRGPEIGRFFAHGDLRLVILHLIIEKPRHGYEIIKAVEDQVAGAYSPSPGVIYPTLTLLEELGYVEVRPGDGTRKLHEITDAGRAFLAANRVAVEGLLAQMAEASRLHGGGPAPQILRAMENLKLALRLRMARGPLATGQVEVIKAALDAAANAVERS
jgi:DNA-binding PadR family transcriptional regulator